ncbi:DegQ family serine endoprotease [Paraherbaspirillum soli]|uniref:Probable periplasmic serine endoprotease DegP-like n=1 Tax=Paraherbaspirillum soli TaxID=631222 RepID=A0ABW0M9E0_9BURK
MTRRSLARSAIAAALLTGIAGIYIYSDGAGIGGPDAHAPTVAAPAPIATDFSSIVERAGPAVVNISFTGNLKAGSTLGDSSGMPQLTPGDPLYEFFKRFGPQLQVPRGALIVHGQGSGFIINPDGVILTNAHVVDGADEVIVKLTDRREFKAKVLGVDKLTDIAVIQIEANHLPTVQIGNPALTKVGEPVLAIGSPYGFDNTATAGIVSAKLRSLPGENYVPFIQTDVAVNPGSSGGPLFNLRGEVIGINSQIYSQTGGYQGLSFAIPIDVAIKVEQQLVQHGKVTRGHLGVDVQDVNQALAESFGLKKSEGALISSVENGSPAEEGGLQTGDVILRFNGQHIAHPADLSAAVADTAPGTSAKVDVIRHGEEKTLAVNVSEMQASKSDDSDAGAQDRLGLSVRALTQDERQQAGVSAGLLVESASGPAAVAGIQSGDVILSFNGVPVTSVEQLRRLVDKAGKSVALLVQRDNEKIFIPLKLG